MADHRAAKRYARALHEAASKSKETDSVSADLGSIVSLLEGNARFAEFILSPETVTEDKVKLVNELFDDRVTATTLALLRLILAKGREAEIFAIRDEFEAMRKSELNMASVRIESAFELSADQKAELIKKAETLSGKKADATFEVTPSLIGGVLIQFENVIYDGTLKGQLSKLKNSLAFDLTHPAN